MTRYAITPPQLKDARGIGYKHAVVDGGTYSMAGQVAIDEHSNVIGEAIETHVRKHYENVEILLETIDKAFADLAKVRPFRNTSSWRTKTASWRSKSKSRSQPKTYTGPIPTAT
ncbi:RidA family protein [Halobellus ordinarius]|uniref:RidA family protein n=1 Tax=Halobellus ordinarius TaxID=3075120 RepID=UPI00287FF5A5|nr:RidA family protein [Halobellus sp. ZY16]